MNSRNELPNVTNNDQELRSQIESNRAMHRRPPISTDPAHVEELERENVRLQLLVAELLIKNQQLRRVD
jgi:hypothetical protein